MISTPIESVVRIFVALVFVCVSIVSTAQDQPVPEYVMVNEFPDSVASFSLTTPEGNVTTFGEMLRSYRGKKVVIDIWASWCRDCIIGLPALDDLKKKTGESSVVYVMLSVDKDVDKWKSAIARFNIAGPHFLAAGGWKNPLASYIVLDWVPRYLIMDETGKVVMPKAIVASDPALRRILLP